MIVAKSLGDSVASGSSLLLVFIAWLGEDPTTIPRVVLLLNR